MIVSIQLRRWYTYHKTQAGIKIIDHKNSKWKIQFFFCKIKKMFVKQYKIN